jgi:hypothetical protein
MRSSNSRRHSQRPFPEWIPRCIQDLVQILYNDANRYKARAKDVDVLDRLTLDPRMKRVWDELLKKKRLNYGKTEQYVHPTATYEGKRFWSFAARSLQSRADAGNTGRDRGTQYLFSTTPCEICASGAGADLLVLHRVHICAGDAAISPRGRGAKGCL